MVITTTITTILAPNGVLMAMQHRVVSCECVVHTTGTQSEKEAAADRSLGGSATGQPAGSSAAGQTGPEGRSLCNPSSSALRSIPGGGSQSRTVSQTLLDGNTYARQLRASQSQRAQHGQRNQQGQVRRWEAQARCKQALQSAGLVSGSINTALGCRQQHDGFRHPPTCTPPAVSTPTIDRAGVRQFKCPA